MAYNKFNIFSKIVLIFVLTVFISYLTSFPIGLIYKRIFNLPGTYFGSLDIKLWGFLISFPFWLGLFGTALLSYIRQSLVFILLTLFIYLVGITVFDQPYSVLKLLGSLGITLLALVPGILLGTLFKALKKKVRK